MVSNDLIFLSTTIHSAKVRKTMKGETNYWEKEIIKIEVYWHMIEKYKELTKIHKSFKNHKSYQ